MKINAFVIFFLFLLKAVYPINIDSLNKIINYGTDTAIINAYITLGDIYENKDYDSSLVFYNNALNIATNINNKKELVRVYIQIGELYKDKGDYDIAKQNFDFALKLNNKIESKTFYNKIYNQLGILYKTQGQYKMAVQYYKKALKYDDGTGYASYIYVNIGNIYNVIGDYDNAILHYKKAISNASKEDENTVCSSSYNGIGVIEYMKGNYNDAIKNFQKTLEIKEKINDLKGMSMCYNNIGLVHYEQSNFKKAIKYHEKSLTTFNKLGNKLGIANSYSNLGLDYIEVQDYVKANKYYNLAIKIYEEMGNKYELANVYSNIGDLYYEQNKIRKAKYYYEKALNIKQEIEDKEGESVIFIRLSHIYNAIGDSTYNDKFYKIAVRYGQNGLKIAKEINTNPDKINAYESLSNSYAKLNDLTNAYKYLKLYIQVKDSIFTEKKMAEIEQLEAKYDSDKKEQEIERNKIIIKQKETEAAKQKIQQNALIIGFLLSIGMVVLILINLKNKKKANKLLQKQKDEIFEKNTELNQQNEEILAQRDEINSQKQHIEKIHLNLTESIDYAKSIQSSVLPNKDFLTKYLSDAFVTFLPKDVVSGDFYWWTKIDDIIVVAAADCTGHGVPGAFMSMLGISLLNEIVKKEKIIKPNLILNRLRKEIVSSLKQDGKLFEQKDGMDMALVSINTKTNILEYAGSNNPLYIIKHKGFIPNYTLDKFKSLDSLEGLYEIKPNKMPISIYARMESFTNYKIQLEKNDIIYLFSDGYADQFGGKKGKKFKYKNFKKLLFENSYKPMNQQQTIVEETFYNWKNNLNQIDDILVMGIKI